MGGQALAVFRSGDEDGELQRAADAAQREGAAQTIVGRAVGAEGDFLDTRGDELGGGMMRHVEEIGSVQVRDELAIERGVGEVFIGDAGHVHGEAGGDELALTQNNVAGGELHRAPVVVKEVAADPADDAPGGVEAKCAIGNGRLRELAMAFERQTGGLPFGESALKGLRLCVTSRAEFCRSRRGVQRSLARAVNNERG